MAAGDGGTLYVVATPLGNLGDITARAAATLAEVDLIAAEDTRHTARLLNHLEIRKPQMSCHKFNEARTEGAILSALAGGRSVALVTDAGTPALSDPGFRLVAAVHDAGYRVVPVPGPSAAAAALSVSGLPADRFHFAGFLPARAAARRRELARLAATETTLVVYEAPHRLRAFLDDALVALGDRPAVLCRELTKLHEEVRRGTLRTLLEDVAARPEVRGEIALVIAGCPAGVAARTSSGPEPDLLARWQAALAAEDADRRRALRRLAREMGQDRAALRRRLQAGGILPS